MEEVEYLGHIVGREGVKVDPQKDPGNAGVASTSDLEKPERIFGSHRLLSQICPQLWSHRKAPHLTLEEKFILLE